MSNTVIVFSLDGCGHCKMLKDELNSQSIPYTEIEISSNKEIWDQVVNQTGHNILPTVFIKKPDTDDGPVFVPQRDFKNQDEIVEIIKTYI